MHTGIISLLCNLGVCNFFSSGCSCFSFQTMLNGGDEDQPCLVWDCGGKFQCQLWIFQTILLLHWEHSLPCMHNLTWVIIMKRCWVPMLLLGLWRGSWGFSSFILRMGCIPLTALCMWKQPYIEGINSTWSLGGWAFILHHTHTKKHKMKLMTYT